MPNVAQDFTLVIDRVNQLERAIKAVNKENQALRAAQAASTDAMTKSTTQTTRNVQRMGRDISNAYQTAGKSIQYMTNPMAVANQRTMQSTRLLNSQRFALFQITSGVQDAALAFQQMGLTTQGWTMAMRGASNNLGVMLSTMGPVTAIVGTLGLVVGPPLISWLLKLKDTSQEAAVAVRATGSAAIEASKHYESMRDAIAGVEEAQRSLAEATQPEGARKDIQAQRAARAEELQTQMRQGGAAMQEALQAGIEAQVEERTKPEQEALERRRAAGLGELYAMTGGISPTDKQRARRLRLIEQSAKFRTDEEINLAETQGKVTKEEADMLKRRLAVQREEQEFEKRKQEVRRDVVRETERKIERGEVPPGMPLSQEEIDRRAEETLRTQEHAELLRKHREARRRVETATGQEDIDVLQQRARPLQEESKEISRQLSLSPAERRRLNMERLTKRQRAEMEQRRLELQRQLEDIAEQEQNIRWQTRELGRRGRGLAGGGEEVPGAAVGGGAGPQSLTDLPMRLPSAEQAYGGKAGTTIPIPNWKPSGMSSEEKSMWQAQNTFLEKLLVSQALKPFNRNAQL